LCLEELRSVAGIFRIAVYKALYRFIGGYIADVVAAVDQAVADGVDILSLSLGPNTPSGYSNVTFLNVFDVALLSAVKSDVLVVQAVGNGGPNPKTVLSFSPWILSVAAGVDDRSYPHYVRLANNMSFSGMGLAPSTPGEGFQTLVWADDAALGLTNPLSSPSDCQDPTILNASLLQGKILICTYSFDFAFGSASLQQVVGTVQTLGAVGFIMVVQSDLGPNKLDPIPFVVPAIVLTSLQDSQSLMNYYNNFTSRDSAGNVLKYGAAARINSGQVAQYSGQCQQVALFSSRGPDAEDSSYDEADVLKPNVMVPGYQIWAAWTPIGIDAPGFQGENFAMISGTSMATPHAAGIAALLVEAHPDWSPAALASAMMTTANTVDHQGLPLQAQQLSGLGSLVLNAATPFDFGSGAVNPTAALDPGLIFDAGHDDYIKFLCSVQGVSALAVYNTTGGICSEALPGAKPTDLNLPSITIADLLGTRIVPRMVTNVASESEMYELTWTNPGNVSLSIVPLTFTVDPMQSQNLTFTLSATYTTDITTFGEVLLTGSLGHIVHIPISVMNKTVGV
jgi:subtilisin family serine protease